MAADNKFGKDRFDDLKAADALSRLNERSRSSRTLVLLSTVIGLIVLALAVGFIINSVRSGNNAPEIPTVGIL